MNTIELFSRFAESIADPVLVLDADLTIVLGNAAAAEMLGIDRKGLAGHSIAKFVDDSPEEISGKVRQWARSSSGLPAALRFRTQSTDRLRVHCTGAAIHLDSRRLVILHCRPGQEPTRRFVALNEKIEQLAREIAERGRAEAALRESEIRFRSIFEQASDAIIITDENGRIIDANPAACELVGRSTEQLRELTPIDLAPPGQRPAASELWQDFVSRPTQRGTFTIQRPDGELRHTEYSAVHDFIPGRSLSIVRDVTERKRIEAERDRKTAELARSNAELERFAYIASHDLQEPLRTMHSFAQLLDRRMDGNQDEEVRECLHFIVDSALRMRRIILDLLDFSRLGQAALNIRQVSIATVIEAAAENLAVAIAECGATLEVGDLPVVEADETQMIQLFQNLIGNAIKFRSSGSPRVRIYANVNQEEWSCSVSDNGPGIAPEYFDTVFEAFKRLHGKDVPGTGIGLAVCRRIVENHHGRIWVESELGRGSTFHFVMPLSQDRRNETTLLTPVMTRRL